MQVEKRSSRRGGLSRVTRGGLEPSSPGPGYTLRQQDTLESRYFAWGPGAGVAPLVEFSVLPFTHVHWVRGRRHPEAVGLESLTESRTDGGGGPHTPDAGHATWASRLQHRPRAGWDRTCLSLGTGRRLAPGM